jgi:hypothetical protein
MIATNAGGELATKAAVKFIAKKIPGLGAIIAAGDMTKAFNSFGDVEKVITIVDRANTAKNIIGGSTAAASMYWTKQLRQSETNGEAINALAQRVLNKSFKT